MPRSKFRARLHRKARFHDREGAIAAIEEHFRLFKADPDYFRVVSLLGIGGIGKTRLMDHLEERALQPDLAFKVVRVSLEAEASASSVGPLKVIRDQTGMQCLLFDCAVIAYWAATGQPLQTPAGGAFSQSLIVKSVEAGAGVAGLGLPLAFAGEAFDRIQKEAAKHRFYDRDEFKGIDALRARPDQLLARLPYFLGLDIDRRQRAGARPLIFFYDAYEKQSRASIDNGAEWLREFIGTLERSVHIIASREPLRWPAVDWADVSEEIVVGELPSEFAIALVREELPDADEAVLQGILDVAQGVPFYIEAGLDAYEAIREAKGAVTPADLPRTHSQATARLFDHLGADERALVAAVSMLQTFDEPVFVALARDFNASTAAFSFHDLTQLFFVENLQLGDGLFKTHNIVAGFVLQDPRHEATRQRTINAASRLLVARLAGGLSGETALLHLRALLRLAGSARLESRAMLDIVDAAYALYDRGYWRELIAITVDHPDAKGDAGLIASFFAAICQRRITGVGAARAALAELAPRAERLGKYASVIALESAYLEELVGDYRSAGEIFESLASTSIPFEPISRVHVRAVLCHADMLTMRGEMTEASRLLAETADTLAHSSLIDWAEFTRHRAHAARFSFLLEEAEALYLRALDAASDSASLSAKLRTNLAETRCLTDPHRAIDDGLLALELNARLGNQIEIGKAHVALAVASGALGRIDEVGSHIADARAAFDRMGYQSGMLFADIAEGFQALAAGELVALDASITKATARSDTLGVYGHLSLCLRVARTGWLDEHVGETTGWIEAERAEQRIKHITARFAAHLRRA